MLEFGNSSTSASNASSMLSMINMNMHEAASARQNPFHLLNSSTGPLTALHSMADLKASAVSRQSMSNFRNSPTSVGLKQPISVTTSSTSPGISSSSPSSSASGTSHFINDILSRPATLAATQSTTALGTALAGALPRFNLGAAAVGGMYFGPSNGGLHKLALGDLSGRSLYWPSMVQNQALWRERLAGTGKAISLFKRPFFRRSVMLFYAKES